MSKGKYKPSVCAILCSDLHLSHRPPIYRSKEPDWYAAMGRMLEQLGTVAAKYDAPILCAGDVFDHWNPPAELINWAIEHMPEMYAICGQHDLPGHELSEVHRTGFETLHRAGIIKYLYNDDLLEIRLNSSKERYMHVHGFDWGQPLEPLSPANRDPFTLNVAVVHKYISKVGARYIGAPEESDITRYRKQLQGFNVAVFGDNHIPFLGKVGGCTVFNHGGAMRRRIDDRHDPAFGLLLTDGTVILHKQDTSKDVYWDHKDTQGITIDSEAFGVDEFLRDLNALGRTSLDFTQTVREYLDKYETSPGARRIILETLKMDRNNR